MRIYILNHIIVRTNNVSDTKRIGFYSTMAKLEQARKRVESKPGFRNPSGRFIIETYRLDEDRWTSRFFCRRKRVDIKMSPVERCVDLEQGNHDRFPHAARYRARRRIELQFLLKEGWKVTREARGFRVTAQTGTLGTDTKTRDLREEAWRIAHFDCLRARCQHLPERGRQLYDHFQAICRRRY